MLSYEELLNIVCSEAVEYGGLQEVPGHKHGARHSYHAAKRGARDSEQGQAEHAESDVPPVQYALRLVRHEDGSMQWED